MSIDTCEKCGEKMKVRMVATWCGEADFDFTCENCKE